MTNAISVSPAFSRLRYPGVARQLRRLFCFPAVLAFGLVFLTFWTCAPRFEDPDLWWHLKVGQTIWSTHQIPTADHFSFTAAGHPWLAHEWLSQVILFGVYQVGGNRGLLLWLCVTASAIVVLSYFLCRCWSGNWKVSFAGGMLTLFFLVVSLAIRPLLIGHFLLVLELLLLYIGFLHKPAVLWFLPLLFAIWINCHGSFILGFGILAGIATLRCLQLLGGRVTSLRNLRKKGMLLRYALLVIASFAALFVNPVGPALITYPLNVLGSQPDNINNIQEWAPLTIHEPGAIGLALVLALVILSAVMRWTGPRWIEWGLLLGTAALAILHVRMLPVFGIVCAPVVCRILAKWWDNYDSRRDHPLLNAMLITAALFSAGAVLPGAAEIQRQIEQRQPVKAVAEIQRQRLQGPMLNEYGWGGYLIWSNPGMPVFIDGRADIYAWSGLMRAFGRWAQLEEDPRLLLDRYGIRLCLLRASAPMAQVLPYLPGWKQAYRDGIAVVFTKVSAP
ncbi:MAG TPA: hypothetical protein VM120_13645 [Bryobacteraceae bacterium]|nr:hypothetical protein [Bryobacteraceae bacterium]